MSLSAERISVWVMAGPLTGAALTISERIAIIWKHMFSSFQKWLRAAPMSGPVMQCPRRRPMPILKHQGMEGGTRGYRGCWLVPLLWIDPVRIL